MPGLVFLLAPLLIAGVIAAIVYGVRMERKRREAMQAWAAARGWRIDTDKTSGYSLDFGLFREGHSRWARYRTRGEVDDAVPGLGSLAVELFEYHYAVTTSNGKSSTTHHYHFTCAHADLGLDLGQVVIRKEHWGDKLVQAIGFDDIDLEDPDFSKRFMVKAADRRDAYELLGRDLMDYLLANDGWRVETLGRSLLAYRKGSPKPEDYDALLGFVEGLSRSLPRVFVNSERERRGLSPVLDAGSAADDHAASRGGRA